MVSSLEEIEHIVDEYSGMLYRIALHYVRTKSEAEDVIQEVYLRLIRSKPAFDSSEHEKAWLIRATGQVCKDFLKTSWRQKTVSLQDNLSQADHLYAAEDPASAEILPAVRKLPEKYRTVVYLYYYEDMPVSDIARMLSVSENTISSWLHRARAKLKLLLKGEWK